MERVKVAVCRMPASDADPVVARSGAVASAAGAVSSVRFGDEVAFLGDGPDVSRFVEGAARAGFAARERPGELDRRRLHVVMQKGRLFQRAHPDVPVILDKGRFLLVEMEPKRAAQAGKSDVPCFSVRPLEALETARAHGPGRVVFEARDRAADRRLARAANPAVQALVDRISGTTFEADLAQLVALHTRLSTSTHYTQACDLVEQQLTLLGYPTSRQSIAVGGLASANVIARRRGCGPAPRGLVLVTAHLDSVNHEGDAASVAPGADDDGSGSAGVIEIARALKDFRGLHDVQFVLFGGEEQGLLGSKRFVASLTAAQRARVLAVVNMDMIASLNTPAPTVLLEGAPVSQGVLDGLAAAAATYTGLAVQTSLNAADSDHVPFIRKGMPGVLTIEGADGANDRIHTARDTLEHIDRDLALEILRMNTAFIAETLGIA